MANTQTLQDIRNLVYDDLKEDQNVSAYTYVLVDSLINRAQR